MHGIVLFCSGQCLPVRVTPDPARNHDSCCDLFRAHGIQRLPHRIMLQAGSNDIYGKMNGKVGISPDTPYGVSV
jgi:hypothetical protein